jgi:hypothetical protein
MPRDCPICSRPLVPGLLGRPSHCPNCDPITDTPSTPAWGGRRRDYEDEDEYDRPRRRRAYEDDQDEEDHRFVRRRGVATSARVVGGLMLGVGALGLLGNGLIFCVGFHEEFFINQQPDPIGVALLCGLAVAIAAGLLAMAGGLCSVVGRYYWLAITGCAAVVVASHLCFLGLVVGIVGLVFLLQADVRKSFC